MSLLEGVFSRGDRRLARVIESAWRKGARFDGWGEFFDIDIDEAFLKQWISDPAGTEHRAPVYWSNYGDPTAVPANPPIALGPTQMPQLAFTEEELDLVVEYLLGLK